MRILGIETSCDETGLSVISGTGSLEQPQITVEKEVLASQIELHRPWGGVVPGLARRAHEENLPLLFTQLNVDPSSIDVLAVTVGPGLDPCLWSGVSYAQELQKKTFPHATLVGANHLEGHLYSFLLDGQMAPDIFPAVHLLVSGGHTLLMVMEHLTTWKIIGETRDDAVGEAFDKVARMLELPYPGGPEIEREAQAGNPQAIPFPRPMEHSGDFDFSFSGLKTAVLYYLKNNPDAPVPDVAASFQEAALDILIKKTMAAATQYGARTVMISGGVASNNALRDRMKEAAQAQDLQYYAPPKKYNTDNGAMIAAAAYINQLSGTSYEVRAQPNLGL